MEGNLNWSVGNSYEVDSTVGISLGDNFPFFGNRNNRKVRNLGESGICLVAEEIVRTCKKLVLRIGIFHVGVIHNFGV